MGRKSLDKGRRFEKEVARRLTEWALPLWRFRRRGLGFSGLPDLIGEAERAPCPWPLPISVKGAPRWTLSRLVTREPRTTHHVWREWEELAAVPVFYSGQVVPRLVVGGGWLIWRAEATWWLTMPFVQAAAWHRMLPGLYLPAKREATVTFELDDFLGHVTVESAWEVIRTVIAVARGRGELVMQEGRGNVLREG